MFEELKDMYRKASPSELLGAAFVALIIVALLSMLFNATKAHAADFRFGPYAGVVVGYNSSQTSGAGVDINGNGALVNGILGVNLNGGGGFVYGLEGDFGYSGVTGNFKDGGGASLTSSADWNGSVRARAGALLGSTLLYATAGVAFSNDTAKASAAGSSGSETSISTGFVGGVGADMQITNTVALRIEALEYAYPTADFAFNDLGNAKFDHQDTVVRAGLVFDLN